jgi:two-component system response regulator HydG
MAKILFVEDDPAFAMMIELFLRKKGHQTYSCRRAREAEKAIEKEKFDLLLLDYRLPDGTGLDVMRLARQKHGAIPAVIMTSLNDIRTAVRAMRAGAFDYIAKPVNHEELQMVLEEALHSKETPFDEPPKATTQESIQGDSSVAKEMYDMIDLVAPTDMSVLILGESGTGKEHIARNIHAKSARADGPFMAIDCGLPFNELAISELFGHKQGAFTGAGANKKGKFEAANGGTLFLDEVGNLHYEVQIKLLRALQERVITPLGAIEEIAIDVRILTATNDELWKRVQEGAFREDLYHRLNEFSLRAPPLRDRLDDLPDFIQFFIEQANRDLKKSVEGLKPETRERLETYDWPGNLRELRNVIKRAVLLTGEGLIGVEALPTDLAMRINHSPGRSGDLRAQRQEKERELILETLRDCRYNKTKTARKLNIDRKTLYNKMRQYGIT